MAKYYYKRRYYRKRKGIWSTRISNISGSQSVNYQNDAIIYYNLCQNPSQSDSTVSNKYTVKNVNLQLEISAEATNNQQNSLENFQAYVMFIPQGYVPTGVPSAYGTLPFDHPEWIMSHRFIGAPVSDTPYFPPLRIFSRLARKLDTGDRIVLIILGNNTATSGSIELSYRGLVKYNTKAN